MQKLFFSSVLALMSFGAASPSFAACDGKKEVRDAWKDYGGENLMTEAANKLKTACGCAPKLSIDCKGFTKGDQIYQVRHAFGELASTGEAYCTDKPSKDEWCKAAKSMVVKGGKPGNIDCRGGTITVTAEGGDAGFAGSTFKEKCL